MSAENIDFLEQLYNSAQKRKRTVVPISTKLEILKKLEEGFTSKHLAREYGLGQSTIYDVTKNADKLMEYASKLENSELKLTRLNNISYIKKVKCICTDDEYDIMSQNSGSQTVSGNARVTFDANCDRKVITQLSELRPLPNTRGRNIRVRKSEDLQSDLSSCLLPLQVPDLSDRMGMEGQPSPSKLDGPSNYLTCSPILPGMPGMHEDTLLGAGPSLSSQEQIDSDNLQVDYEQEIDVKVEPLFNVSPEICEDENSMTNTQSSSDRPSPHSSPTPGMAGPYLLKKETHCTTILDQLLRDDTFTDVTLTAEGQSIKAHKIVLCLASAYFRQVLSKESNVQNVIVFRDIKFSELKNIINFIYTGEATVDASELESFMKTAEMLEVTSLCEGQRNMPKNLPRAREEQSERPNKGSASAKRTQVASHGSPPAKSRKMNDQSTSPRVSKSAAYASTSGTSAVSLPCVLPSEIKSEPTTSDDYTLEDDVASRDDDDDGAYGNHDTSPGDYQVPGEPPMMEIEHTPDKVAPGKCPFCPQASQQVRKGPTLSKHLLICHNDKTAFCCDVCARVFFKKRSFEVHKEDCVR